MSPFFIPLSQDPLHSVLVEGKNFLLDKKQLQPNVCYTAHVKAKLCPGELYEGPWSEWSSTAEWRTEGGAEKETIGRNTFYPPQVSLLILHSDFPETGSVKFVYRNISVHIYLFLLSQDLRFYSTSACLSCLPWLWWPWV